MLPPTNELKSSQIPAELNNIFSDEILLQELIYIKDILFIMWSGPFHELRLLV